MKTGPFAAIVAAVFVMGAGIQLLNAQAARSYTWYAELASIDQAARTMTVKVTIRDGVTRYVKLYKPGDKVMLTWAPISGESDTVIYVPKYEVMKGIDEGFILPAEFVAVDAASHSLTVKAAAPPAVLQALQSVSPGRWIKVTAPMKQPAETAALTSAVAAEKPNLKPPAPPPAATGTANAGRGRGTAPAPTPAAAPGPATAPAAGAGGAVGTWTVTSEISGNSTSSECVFAVQETKLTGTCSGQLGQAQVTGVVTGANIQFQYNVSVNGMSLDFAYSGTVDGGAMKGSVSVFGISGDFSAKRK